MRINKRKILKGFRIAVLFVYILFVLWATIFSRAKGSHGKIMLIPMSAWGVTREYHRHFIANLFMLLPVGFLLPGISTILNSWKIIVALCALFALCLETTQLITGTGDFQIDDLWTNTFSALVGYWLRRLLIKGEK